MGGGERGGGGGGGGVGSVDASELVDAALCDALGALCGAALQLTVLVFVSIPCAHVAQLGLRGVSGAWVASPGWWLVGALPAGALLLLPALYLTAMLFSALAIRAVRALLRLHPQGEAGPLSVHEAGWSVVALLLGFCPVHVVGGTELLTAWWRAVGVRVGRGAYLEVAPPPEIDLVEVGDGVVLADGVQLYPEPGVKAGAPAKAHIVQRVRVGKHAVCCGPDSALQSGAIVGNGCVFTPLTLVQKQGVLPASMVWTGTPAEKLANLPPRAWERSPAARSTEREKKRT